ncbi:hypothetical protein B0H14DRAFT_3629257 [Mycena olivaceomarginata]|nr:hypothetical protein B0H14DRAFT_3629257 [Mycena olivaceomarginata]
MTSQFLIPIVATVGLYAVYHLVKMVQKDNTHPLRDLPGPKGGNFLIGHYRKLFQNHSVTDKWGEELGANYQLRGLFNRRELYTTDTKALTHILVNDDIYQKGHGEFTFRLAKRACARANGLVRAWAWIWV